MKVFKIVELFAGVGGFRLGFENASKKSFQTIWANQWEPSRKAQHAYNCYVKNFGENSCINEDIAKVINDVPEHNILCGGFPCQDYSVAATGAKGIKGKKGVLWWSIRDIIELRNPEYILLENVDRLLKSPSKQRGRDFGVMLKSLYDLGYDVEWRVINAAEYGEVQRRRRIYIFAYNKSTNYYKTISHKNDKKELLLKSGFFADIFPVNDYNLKKVYDCNLLEYSNILDVSDNFKASFFNSGILIDGNIFTLETNPAPTTINPLRTIVHKENVDNKYFLTDAQIQKFDYLRGHKKILRRKPNGEKYYYTEGKMSSFDSLDLPSRTMLTTEGGINRSTHIIEDPHTNKLRFLTPIECERLNGFPDNWTNTGMPESFRYFCMGNALVIPIVTKIANKIKKIG